MLTIPTKVARLALKKGKLNQQCPQSFKSSSVDLAFNPILFRTSQLFSSMSNNQKNNKDDASSGNGLPQSYPAGTGGNVLIDVEHFDPQDLSTAERVSDQDLQGHLQQNHPDCYYLQAEKTLDGGLIIRRWKGSEAGKDKKDKKKRKFQRNKSPHHRGFNNGGNRKDGGNNGGNNGGHGPGSSGGTAIGAS